MKKLQFLLCLAICFGTRAGAQPATSLPVQKYELKLISIFEDNKTQYIFAIGNSGFRNVDSLKRFLGRMPAGTELEWAPGCMRMGGEPLLSSEEEMKDFSKFLADHGITFTLIPSG